jgi:isoquinoline 1-oxidoreductase subunit beta
MRSRRDVLRHSKDGRPLDQQTVSRRTFLSVGLASTGGLLVSLRVVDAAAIAQGTPSMVDGFPTAYIQIDPDDRILIWSAQPEMGEGTKTSLPMIVAEELDADWTNVRIEDAPLDRAKYGGQGVGGSDAIRSDWDRLRRIGATARALLIGAAAAEWGVPASECDTTAGVVHHRATERERRYGALATRAASMPAPAMPLTLKRPDAFRIIGTRVSGIDTHKIAMGEGLFGLDVKLPGMKYAAIAKCPVFGGRPVAIDATRARQVPGVRDVVEIKGLDNPTFLMPGVAVVADSTWAAFKGRDALNVTWDEGAFAGDSNDSLREQFRGLLAAPPATLHNSGDVERALVESAHRVDNTFDFGFVSHATLEPHNCTADVKDGTCTIRGPLQMPASGRQVVAQALGIPPERVQVHSTRIGGGFGRRLLSDYAAEAAVVSRAIGAPVQVVDTRTGDLQHDYYRPAAMQRLRAGIDAHGRIVAWDHTMASVSRNAYRLDPRPPHSTEMYGSYIGRVTETREMDPDMQPTRIPHVRVRYGSPRTGVPTGAWRAPSHVVNAFAIETTIDELAQLAGLSAVDVRLDLLASPEEIPRAADDPSPYDPDRMRRVLVAAAERGGFGQRAPEGRARGLAMHHTFGSYVAEVVELSVDARKRVVVHRVVLVADVGQPVNLSDLEAQAQGGTIDALGAAFFGEVTIARGRAVETNFDGYRLIRQREAPAAIDVHILASRERPTGFGEPPVPPLAPAVANAIAALTGERLRQMPFARLGWSL